MKRMKLIALAAAVVLGVCVYKFLGVISQPKEDPRTNVVVCVVDIPENTTITADMVKMEAVLTESVLPNSVTDLESVVGMVMNSDMYAGEQVLASRLVQMGAADAASDTLAYVVEPGMRAVTVAVGPTSGLSNMIRPGNSVDLVMYYTDSPTGNPDEGNPLASIIMQDIQVLAIDSTIRKGASNPEGYSTVTLMVTPEQAVEISFAEQYHALRLILRSSVDDAVVSKNEVNLNTVRN